MENRNYFTERDVERLETQAVQIRQDIISMIHSAKAGPAYKPMIKTALSAQAPTFIHLRFLILIPPRIFINRKAVFHVFFIFNIMGLGWAATPAGLKAMKELEKVEEERRKEKVAKRTIHAVSKGTASNEMCTFLIMNISSLQLIPVNIIAYRSQYHSTSPAAVTGPCFAATMVSTLAAVIFCKIMDHLRNPT